MSKKFLAKLLVLSMAVSMLSVNAFAWTYESGTATATKANDSLNELYTTSNDAVTPDANNSAYFTLKDAVYLVAKDTYSIGTDTDKLIVPSGKTLNVTGTVNAQLEVSGSLYRGSDATTFTKVIVKRDGKVYFNPSEVYNVQADTGLVFKQSGDYWYATTSGSSGGGGSGGSSSNVTVQSATDGRVSVSPSNPKKGDTVTLTPKPKDGYEIASIVVKDKNGNEIKVTKNSDGTFSFVMPDGKVTITPVFEKVPETVAGFADVKESDWYAGAVKFATEKGIMAGVGDGNFAPQTTTSRAMLVQMLYALEGKPTAGSTSFTDVSSGDWFASAAAWASANGIVSGLGDGKFGPNQDLTREQMALILYGYAKMKGYDVTVKGDLSAYADQTSVSSWASEAVAWAVGAGMISGRTTTTLVPGGIATRAEMAQIMMRFCENVVK